MMVIGGSFRCADVAVSMNPDFLYGRCIAEKKRVGRKLMGDEGNGDVGLPLNETKSNRRNEHD
jgi:hypothetical protein